MYAIACVCLSGFETVHRYLISWSIFCSLCVSTFGKYVIRFLQIMPTENVRLLNLHTTLHTYVYDVPIGLCMSNTGIYLRYICRYKHESIIRTLVRCIFIKLIFYADMYVHYIYVHLSKNDLTKKRKKYTKCIFGICTW